MINIFPDENESTQKTNEHLASSTSNINGKNLFDLYRLLILQLFVNVQLE